MCTGEFITCLVLRDKIPHVIGKVAVLLLYIILFP